MPSLPLNTIYCLLSFFYFMPLFQTPHQSFDTHVAKPYTLTCFVKDTMCHRHWCLVPVPPGSWPAWCFQVECSYLPSLILIQCEWECSTYFPSHLDWSWTYRPGAVKHYLAVMLRSLFLWIRSEDTVIYCSFQRVEVLMFGITMFGAWIPTQ